jgi:hypothetical protein
MPARTMTVVGTCFLLAAVLPAPPAPAQEATGCTLTQGFWKTHPEAWRVQIMIVGGQEYDQEQLIGILSAAPRGDATYILAKQLIAAQLNVLNGADSSGVATLINEAEAWLIAQGLGSWPTGDARTVGTDLAGQLDDFNNGLSGVPHCEDGATPPPPPPPVEE